MKRYVTQYRGRGGHWYLLTTNSHRRIRRVARAHGVAFYDSRDGMLHRYGGGIWS